MNPARNRTGSGHQAGTSSKPRPSGRSSNTQVCICAVSSSSAHDPRDTTSPTTAASRSRTPNDLLLMRSSTCSVVSSWAANEAPGPKDRGDGRAGRARRDPIEATRASRPISVDTGAMNRSRNTDEAARATALLDAQAKAEELFVAAQALVVPGIREQVVSNQVRD